MLDAATTAAHANYLSKTHIHAYLKAVVHALTHCPKKKMNEKYRESWGGSIAI